MAARKCPPPVGPYPIDRKAPDGIEDEVCAQIVHLHATVSPAVAEAVSLALVRGAARALMAVGRAQGRESEIRARLALLLDGPAPSLLH